MPKLDLSDAAKAALRRRSKKSNNLSKFAKSVLKSGAKSRAKARKYNPKAPDTKTYSPTVPEWAIRGEARNRRLGQPATEASAAFSRITTAVSNDSKKKSLRGALSRMMEGLKRGTKLGGGIVRDNILNKQSRSKKRKVYKR